MKKVCCLVLILSLVSGMLTYAEDISTEKVIEDVITDGSNVCASWFYVFENLLSDKAGNGLKFYMILESLRKPELASNIDIVLNNDSNKKLLLESYGLNSSKIYQLINYYIATFPKDMGEVVCYGNHCGKNIYADIYFDEDINYSDYMVRFHIYLNELFSQLTSEMQAPIKKYDRLGAGEIIVMQRLMNIVIRDYLAFETYDTSTGNVMYRDLGLRDEIRLLLIEEFTTIANTYSEEYRNDESKDKSVDSQEIEKYVDAFMALGNVILDSINLNLETDNLMDEVIELSEDVNLLVRTSYTPSVEAQQSVTPITLVMNTDYIELDSSVSLAEGYFNEFKLIPRVTGTNNPVIYSILDSDVANVSEDGIVTLNNVREGFTIIYATIQGYDIYKEIRVEVSEKTPLGSIKFYGPYISGYPDETFQANRMITRAEIATMFARVLMLDVDANSQLKYFKNSFDEVSYSDVQKDHWAYVYVEIAKKEGLLLGYADNTFDPDAPISRAEIAVVISNAWELMGIKSSILANHMILDVDSNHWAYDAINRVYNANIVTGYNDGTFKPDEYTTRAEIVIMINNILDRKSLKSTASSFTDIPKSHWAYGDIESATKYQEVKYELGE
ncbi:MAG: S-layer homology domain-containing protein [Clostridiales bacterium]|nr:S-layer homology domain-containing protein [Clostridiales bacterium]